MGEAQGIAIAIINVFNWIDEKCVTLNGVDAERALRAATRTVIEGLAKKIEDGTATDDTYESVAALMLAHTMVKHDISKNGALKYRCDINGFTVEKE